MSSLNRRLRHIDGNDDGHDAADDTPRFHDETHALIGNGVTSTAQSKQGMSGGIGIGVGVGVGLPMMILSSIAHFVGGALIFSALVVFAHVIGVVDVFAIISATALNVAALTRNPAALASELHRTAAVELSAHPSFAAREWSSLAVGGGDELCPPWAKQLVTDKIEGKHNAVRGRNAESALAVGNTLFVGYVSYGYIDFAYNWICHLQRNRISNFIIGAQDAETYNEMAAMGYERHVILLSKLFNDTTLETECGGAASGSGHNWRSACFAKQTRLKMQFNLYLLAAGYDIVMVDMDISLIKNPLLYMPLTHALESQVDKLEPLESGEHFCTGFYYARSGPVSINMHTHYVWLIVNLPGNGDDQTAMKLWYMYHSKLDPFGMKYHVFRLNHHLFPVGFEEHYGDKRAVIQHNNRIQGAVAKRKRVAQRNLLLYNASATAIKLSARPRRRISSSNSAHTEAVVIGTSESVSTTALVCDVCTVCDETPHLPPLRSEFPPRIDEVLADVTQYAFNG